MYSRRLSVCLFRAMCAGRYLSFFIYMCRCICRGSSHGYLKTNSKLDIYCIIFHPMLGPDVIGLFFRHMDLIICATLHDKTRRRHTTHNHSVLPSWAPGGYQTTGTVGLLCLDFFAASLMSCTCLTITGRLPKGCRLLVSGLTRS